MRNGCIEVTRRTVRKTAIKRDEGIPEGAVGIIIAIKGEVATVRWTRTGKISDVPFAYLKKV